MGNITFPADLITRGVDSKSDKDALDDWFNYAGISNRTVEYRSVEDLITFVLRD